MNITTGTCNQDSSVDNNDCCVRNVSKGSKSSNTLKIRKRRQQIPDELINNLELQKRIGILPSNYNFEILKTLAKIKNENSKIVALQFPEGLLLYACIIADILQEFGGVGILILGDVTYGACCIDDFTAAKLGADLLVHYGHSCLVPVNVTRIKVMYIFVEISFDSQHLQAIMLSNFKPEAHIALMGTIQFTTIAHQAMEELKERMPNVTMPQVKPLSAGETLGCTSAVLVSNCEALVFVADGRFHLESAMIQNPSVPAYRYDPYSKVMTRESYDIVEMKATRRRAIDQAKSAKVFGLILGTLGRQGSRGVFDRLRALLAAHGRKSVLFLMAEINPAKLSLITQVDVWVQVCCPRLSVDWGAFFTKPVISAYELEVVLDETEWREVYPMDYYSKSGGTWTNYS